LRRNQWLIPTIDRDVHEEKHRNISLVPVLGRFTLSWVVREFAPVRGDYIASLDELISVIDEATRVQRLPHDERLYAETTLDALERTRPFIVEGLVR
jgi:hypothetical protein